ncbi:MAG: DNA translocase FtsK [Firmicutes bacterium ADurb.Bin193]|nr:MAG: DNA translocase FtsK [Firmicutes bacterium ADurb.Bin193]
MMDKQALVAELLRKHLGCVKTGIIIKGIEGINPESIVSQLVDTNAQLYTAIIGYGKVTKSHEANYEITDLIEKAVLWRSMPECARRILVFIKNDTDKLHSLAEFDVISTRDVSRFLLEQQLKNDNNTPTHNFWTALKDTSDYYTFDALYEFVSAVSRSDNSAEAIPENMWRINLLSDSKILGTKSDPKERLAKNRDLIFSIGQLREDSRKKLSRSLARSKVSDKERLQKAYHSLQSLYKYGKRETLRDLDMETVQELFSASQESDNKRKKALPPKPEDPSNIEETLPESTPIKPKELDVLISDAVVFGGDEELENIQDLLKALIKHYDPETEENDDDIPPIGGIFGDRNIVLENHQTDLRKLVGKFCNLSAWGGLMETDESVLKDAISADITNAKFFNPESVNSIISFSGGIDGSQPLFDFIVQFDAQFDAKGLDNAERFTAIISNLKEQRAKLYDSIDMIMYHPVLLFGASEEKRQVLVDYIQAWERLYHAFCVNEPIMRQISAGGTSFIARAILLLDVLYVKTPKEWKGLLLPLHPIYLWRFYEVFRTLPNKKSTLSDEDKDALSAVLSQLPQVLSFIIANSIVTESSEDRILPCSGSIEMLPTFENKTNRYLGNDGTESIEEILTRWVGFAPYTRNEIRICSVDAPDLIGIIRQVKSFMDKNSCKRVVYDVYLTRNQNGNTELSKLDYAGKDYEIGEYIKEDRIFIGIKNVRSVNDVKSALDFRPVHVAFYFDQSSYAIEFGPNSHNLYINPLVITYDYDFDEIQHKGSIFPSSEMDSGLIGDYHKLMRSADIITNNMNPRTIYNGNADMTSVVSTIEDGQTQWLVVADRDTNNYQPEKAIPIGEMQYDKRMVNAWASDESRIISQYLNLLRGYNLYPKAETLIDILRQFGHIASNGLISIPKFGADAQAIDNKRKGLIGTLFAASWYMKKHPEALVASLDDDKARLWLQNRKYGNERADLVGLYYDDQSNTLHIQPIEVKTRDESPDATITKDEVGSKVFNITGHAAGQIASVIEILREIFTTDENAADMFTSARREVLKYQIVSECFRNVHNADWQKRWYDILKRAFANGPRKNITINVSGILMHIKLNEASGGEHIVCYNPEFDDCRIDYWKLTAREIQRDVLGDGSLIKEMWTPDFDTAEDNDVVVNDSVDAIIDKDDAVDDIYEEGDITRDIHPPESIPSSNLAVVTEPREKNGAPVISGTPVLETENGVSKEEIEQLVKDFKRSCGDYHVSLRECDAENTVVGPSVIRLKFRLGRGQALQGLSSHLEDIGREMKRTGVIIQQVPNSDELLLDVPRLQREKVLFRDVISSLPRVTSPEQLYFPLGRTPNGVDLIEDLGQMPHMLVGGSTGSGKSVFLFTMLAAMLMTHPRKEDLQLILSSSKLEDFIHFEGLPHLYSGSVISDAIEATKVIKEVIFEESERRGKLLAEARVANIIEYNKIAEEKLAPIVVVIDEFADLADQLENKKEQNAFYKPVQRIAQAGRSRGIHLVICTQRPEAKLVPSTTKAQLNGRVALRVNDGISSRMIIETPDAQYLQKHGDMIYKNGDVVERAQGYLIEIEELDKIVSSVINGTF